jgi:hypothetical protein
MDMKTLTLIVATGALLVAVAPTAGARNSLQCSISAKHSIAVRTVDPELPYDFQLQRGLSYVGTWHPALTRTSCKTLQSETSSSTRTPAANAAQVAKNSL